jgi:hypothetical protein
MKPSMSITGEMINPDASLVSISGKSDPMEVYRND